MTTKQGILVGVSRPSIGHHMRVPVIPWGYRAPSLTKGGAWLSPDSRPLSILGGVSP